MTWLAKRKIDRGALEDEVGPKEVQDGADTDHFQTGHGTHWRTAVVNQGESRSFVRRRRGLPLEEA